MFNFQSLVDYDNTILDGAGLVPAGIDPDILKSEIMIQCGLLQPLYPEPETMKAAIKQWFSARQWTFEHLLNIIAAEYSPIENTDRYDQTTRVIDRDTTDQGSNTRETESTVNTSGESTGQVSAFNSDTWQNSDKNNSTGNTSGTEDVTGTENRSGTEDVTETFTQHLHGNIGVTTNQEMIKQELALLADFNIYTWIAMNLRDSLFLEVY